VAGEVLVLSGSSLNTFLRCARQWEYAYVYRLKSPPSLKQALGIAAHDALEIDLRQKITTREDLPMDMVLDAFADAFKKEGQDAREKPDKGETRPLFMDSGIAAVRKWHSDVAPLYQPVAVEEHVQFKINDVVIDGTLDARDEDGWIRDHKFVGKKPSSGEAYVLNMTGYAIGSRVAHPGTIETGIVLDHVVRTKEPYYFPIASEGPVPDRAIRGYAQIVSDVSRSIKAGIFPPTGLKSNACSWCGYKDRCTAYREQ
jgi:hypothetical protein